MIMDSIYDQCVSQVQSAYFDIEKSHLILSKSIGIDRPNQYENVVAGWINRATAKMASAESLYKILEAETVRTDLASDGVFTFFDYFSKEFFECYNDGHSYQQVFSHYNYLMERFKQSMFAFPDDQDTVYDEDDGK